MPTGKRADLSLFLNILQTLERINAPYMIIGAFAGTFYGINRVTYDIDIDIQINSFCAKPDRSHYARINRGSVPKNLPG